LTQKAPTFRSGKQIIGSLFMHFAQCIWRRGDSLFVYFVMDMSTDFSSLANKHWKFIL